MTSFCVLHRIGSIGPYEIIGLFVVVCVCARDVPWFYRVRIRIHVAYYGYGFIRLWGLCCSTLPAPQTTYLFKDSCKEIIISKPNKRRSLRLQEGLLPDAPCTLLVDT